LVVEVKVAVVFASYSATFGQIISFWQFASYAHPQEFTDFLYR
jgi:hypothetical protein